LGRAPSQAPTFRIQLAAAPLRACRPGRVTYSYNCNISSKQVKGRLLEIFDELHRSEAILLVSSARTASLYVILPSLTPLELRARCRFSFKSDKAAASEMHTWVVRILATARNGREASRCNPCASMHGSSSRRPDASQTRHCWTRRLARAPIRNSLGLLYEVVNFFQKRHCASTRHDVCLRAIARHAGSARVS
jgi:hypothetical protein